jgi:hypothetical protein
VDWDGAEGDVVFALCKRIEDGGVHFGREELRVVSRGSQNFEMGKCGHSIFEGLLTRGRREVLRLRLCCRAGHILK